MNQRMARLQRTRGVITLVLSFIWALLWAVPIVLLLTSGEEIAVAGWFVLWSLCVVPFLLGSGYGIALLSVVGPRLPEQAVRITEDTVEFSGWTGQGLMFRAPRSQSWPRRETRVELAAIRAFNAIAGTHSPMVKFTRVDAKVTRGYPANAVDTPFETVAAALNLSHAVTESLSETDAR